MSVTEFNLDAIIPPSAVSNVLRAGEQSDIFGASIRQITGFQAQLYQAIAGIVERTNDMSLDLHSITADTTVFEGLIENYLKFHPPSIVTKDGVRLDDAMESIESSLDVCFKRLRSCDEMLESLNNKTVECVTQDQYKVHEDKLAMIESWTNEISSFIGGVQKQMAEQKVLIEDKWKSIKSAFKDEVMSFRMQIDSAVDKSELSNYITHSQLSEICSLFATSATQTRQSIPDIIPTVMSQTELSNDERLMKAYDLLKAEKDRISSESRQLSEAFKQLKDMSKTAALYRNSQSPVPQDLQMRHIATDSGFSEATAVFDFSMVRKTDKRTVWTMFNGADSVEFGILPGLDDLLRMDESDEVIITHSQSPEKLSLYDQMIKEVDKLIEKRIQPLFNASGSKLSQRELKALLQNLTDIESVQTSIERLKRSIDMKMDEGSCLQRMEQFVTYDEFYSALENWHKDTVKPRGGYVSVNRAKSTSKAPPSSPRSNTTEATPQIAKKTKVTSSRPVSLVPSRNSKMLSVNEKFLVGDDGKMYLRQINPQEYPFNELRPSSTSRSNYYDRTLLKMEANMIEQVVDNQQFVPVSRPSTVQSKRTQKINEIHPN